MGYTTEFQGSVKITPSLDSNLKKFLDNFVEIRHMRRDTSKIMDMDKSLSLSNSIGFMLGNEGEFYVPPKIEDFGQKHTPDIIDFNTPPRGVPGLWCGWSFSDNQTIEWNGGEKFYDYVEWMKYLIDTFLKPNGYDCNGTIKWRGEEFDDMGTIVVKNNKVTTKKF